MSLRFASEQFARATIHTADEEVASRSSARLLITASTQHEVETVARRVHGGGSRAPFPFVHIGGGEFPVEREILQQYWTSVLAAAAGGSILISAVEETPPAVQDELVEWLARLEFARRPSAEVRLISGTTVSLFDRVAAGAFSDRLFYRLNIIQVRVGDEGARVALI
jgi:DNA-binding NtrC family response regulator